MEVLRQWVKPVWPFGAEPAPPPEVVEYIEVEEMVPQDSWSDFYAYLTGKEDANEDKPGSALSHTSSLSTANSEQPDPSFSKFMATIVTSGESGNHESSEDEAHAAR
jgi:hypothetical protein